MKHQRLFLSLAIIGTALFLGACDDDSGTNGQTQDEGECTQANCDPEVCGDICSTFIHYDNEDNFENNMYDLDGDTIPDKLDNCPDVYNPTQDDSDGDYIGDACAEDADSDGDTIVDSQDNCSGLYNPDQKDSDGDGVGDACTGTVSIADMDGDTIPDRTDNCPRLSNPDQADSNGNGIGDACEPSVDRDVDGDTIPDLQDNCPDIYNPDQEDSNNDGIGDDCTQTLNDRDGDTIPDMADNCPDVVNPDQTDSNHDGTGDACSELPPDQDGTLEHPFVIGTACGQTFRDSRDTKNSTSKLIDFYPDGKTTHIDESGPEYFYQITIAQKSQINISLDSEPTGVDIDIHLLKAVNISNKTVPESDFLARADKAITHTVEPGTYWIVADTYSSNGTAKSGSYSINVVVSSENAGTTTDPFLLACGQPITIPSNFVDQRSTANSTSKVLNKYPGWETTDESGPEYVYKFTINERARFYANLRAPEASGVDIDLHLLSSINPVQLVERDNLQIWQVIEPGTYYIVADTCGTKSGNYILDIVFRPITVTGDTMFNDYILKAVSQIDQQWKKKGYGMSAYTHDLPYGSNTVTKGPKAPLTMCVAATAEVMLTAMNIYASETGDTSVWDHIPYTSWTRQNNMNIKGHIWVDPAYSHGAGDALAAFGMGMNVTFEELVPGSFIGLNRTSGSGHSTTFLAFLDKNCKEYETWNSDIVGFKYYSSQGSATNGGFDYRYAVFSGKTMTCESGKKMDKNVIYPNRGSNMKDAVYLNMGVMYHPDYWLDTSLVQGITSSSAPVASYFNEKVFNGQTDED